MNAFSGFEGSFMGEAGKISDATRLECKICWHVYDPAKGCESWQIPPGTPFTRLPADWRCPNCDALPSGFMALEFEAGEVSSAPVAIKPPPAALPPALPLGEANQQAAARALGARFEEAFRELHRGRMRDVPFLNPALHVQAVGFRPYRDAELGATTLGILITPWFMNIVLVPEEAPEPMPPVGTKSKVRFPSGLYEFIWADRPETGPYRACSLFSPPAEFNSQLMAVDVAVAALAALFDEANREEGARSAEIRALREEELRLATEMVDAAPAAQSAETGEGATTMPSSDNPLSRRALLVPRRSGKEPEPA